MQELPTSARRDARRWLALFACCLAGGTAAANLERQRELYSLTGSGTFGWEVDALADVDGDGIDELIVPSPFRNANEGRVQVFSGRDGHLLHDWTGAPGSAFGVGIDDAGDIDRDGYDDVVIGAPTEGATGAVHVRSGKTGALLLRLAGPAAGEGFGGRVAGAGDLDRDGHGDLLIGAGGSTPAFAGKVYVHSGADGRLLHMLSRNTPGDTFGAGLAPVGDIDLDRVPDIVVGGPNTGGLAFVYSGADGTLRHTLTSPPGAVAFGRFFVSEAGYFDADAVEDVYVGDFAANGVGRAHVYSGADGRLLWEAHGQSNEGLGTGRGWRDLDGDGRGDLILGHYLNSAGARQAGRVTVRSAPDGTVRQTVTNTAASEQLGYDAGALGDVDGDGRQELLLSAANGNRVVVVAGSVAEGAPLVTPAAAHTGLWYQPSHAGEGFVVEALSGGRFAVYWFTYTADGQPRYLFGLGRAVGPRVVVEPLASSRGGRFGGAFSAGEVQNAAQARLVLSFDGCSSGWAEYTVDGVRERQRLTRLTAIDGLGCDGATRSGADVSGSWYRPASSGEGWILQSVGAERYVLLWFSYRADGQQQWFTGQGTRNGRTLRFEALTAGSGGRFGRYFDPAEVRLEPWGSAEFEFADCDNARLRADGRDGRIDLALVRLTALAGLSCSFSR
jgi:hypothetical protein